MTTLFKMKGRNVWYGKYRDHTGKWVRVSLTTDKQTSREMLEAKQQEHTRVAAGVLPVSVLKVDRRSLKDLLPDFIQSMRDDGSSEVHIRTTEARITAVVTALGDLEGERVKRWLAQLRKSGRSIGTSNGYLTACKMFTRWLHRTGKRPSDPLIGLDKMSVETDRKRVRRALTDDEFARLLDAAPLERRWLYLLATNTGLRASELASLTPESFKLDDKPPTVSVRATNTKSRKLATQPLATALVPPLREWLASMAPGEPLWGRTWARDKHGGTWIRRDLERAGVAYKDAEGRQADFHSLRMLYISRLALTLPLATVQKLARHSDPSLTANVYVQLGLGDLADAVNNARLPNVTKNVTKESSESD